MPGRVGDDGKHGGRSITATWRWMSRRTSHAWRLLLRLPVQPDDFLLDVVSHPARAREWRLENFGII
jgi:hypothetical protein